MNLSSQTYMVGNHSGTSQNVSLHNIQGTGNILNTGSNNNASLVQLSAGQVFQGTVTDIRNNQVTIQIDNQFIQAKFQDMVNICIGETLQFVIRENTGKQVTIAPYHEQMNNPVDGTIYKALDAAGLPATDKNIDIINLLLKNNMPVDKQTITTFLAATLRYPDVELSQFVNMMKNSIPLTNDNIELFSQFLGEKESVTTNLKQVMQGLSDTIANAYSSGDTKLVKQLFDALDTTTQVGQEKGSMSHQIDSNMVKAMFDNNLMGELDRLDAKTLLDLVKQQINQGEQSKGMEAFLHSDTFSKAVTAELTNQWGITPEQLNPENLKTVTHHIEQQIQLLQEIKLPNNQSTNLLQNALQMTQQNLATMQQLNQNLAGSKGMKDAFDMMYTQLPLKLKGQLKHSDLYVYRNKHNGGTSSKNMSLLLHLDMEFLGDLDVMIKANDYQINAQFSLSDQEAYEIIEEHLPKLVESLKEKGYFFSASAKYKEKKEEKQIVQQLFEDEMTQASVKRYSFDVRT